MITKSSTHILKYQNTNKTNILNTIFDDFYETTKVYIDLILTNKLSLEKNLSSKDLPSICFKHSQWKQIAYKTASEAIRAELPKIKNRVYKKYKDIYYKCKKKNIHLKFLNTRFSELNINYLKRVKINLSNVSINIDSRLFDIKNGNSFNEFIKIRSPYFYDHKKIAIPIYIPIKHHKHSLKFKDWKRKNTVKLIKKPNGQMFISFIYETEEAAPKSNTNKIIGVDIGVKKLISTSSGEVFGIDLNELYKKISRKKRGSNKYKKSIIHKKNEINRITNQFLETCDFDAIVVERLKNVKHKSKFSKKINNVIQYWNYRAVLNKLKISSKEEGFLFVEVDPSYTSQTCSNCGIINKDNRNGETYSCSTCSIEIDADINAAINIRRRGVYNLSSKRNSNL